MSELSSREIKKTRKGHKCDWCNGNIPSGSAAHHRTYINHSDDNELISEYMHPECWAAMQHWSKVCRQDAMEGYYPGEFARGRIDDDRSAPPEFQPPTPAVK